MGIAKMARRSRTDRLRTRSYVAVLGRSNSAEKLEYTRFWNWQDSPIPLQPPEIAPVATGSRATPEDLRPGQLARFRVPQAPFGLDLGFTMVTDAEVKGLGRFKTMESLDLGGTMISDAGLKELAGLTLEQLAEGSYRGVPFLSQIERGERRMPIDLARHVDTVLKTTDGFLVKGRGRSDDHASEHFQF